MPGASGHLPTTAGSHTDKTAPDSGADGPDIRRTLTCGYRLRQRVIAARDTGRLQACTDIETFVHARAITGALHMILAGPACALPQNPAGDEGFRVGGWVGVIAGRPELAKVTLDEALGTEALLLGRRSYEWLAARWPSRTGALADRLNSLPSTSYTPPPKIPAGQLDGPEGRRGDRGLETEAGTKTGKSKSPPASS